MTVMDMRKEKDGNMGGKALIMMATYNGANYISRQIESICNQTYQDWNLIISDDGSADETLGIIGKFADRDPRIIKVFHHKSDFGASSNFYFLLEMAKGMMSEFDYYFFSDQDDIWRHDKIQRQIDVLKKYKGKYACYSDLMLMDGNENESCRMSQIQSIRMNKPEDIFFNQIYIWGNTLAFTRGLLAAIYIPQGEARKISHDHYIGFYASTFGENVYIDEPLVKYRRYDSNISDLPRQYNLNKVIGKIKNLKTLIRKHAANYGGILYFIKHANVNTENIQLIKECYQCGGLRSLKVMKKIGVTTGSNKWNSKAKRLILLSKIYKKQEEFIRLSSM